MPAPLTHEPADHDLRERCVDSLGLQGPGTIDLDRGRATARLPLPHLRGSVVSPMDPVAVLPTVRTPRSRDFQLAAVVLERKGESERRWDKLVDSRWTVLR